MHQQEMNIFDLNPNLQAWHMFFEMETVLSCTYQFCFHVPQLKVYSLLSISTLAMARDFVAVCSKLLLPAFCYRCQSPRTVKGNTSCYTAEMIALAKMINKE